MPVQEHLAPLYAKYEEILRRKVAGEVFDSHAFILELAQANQGNYIKALRAYADGDEPFRTLHRALSIRIGTHPSLVDRLDDVTTPDIFGDRVPNANWMRVNRPT